MPSASGQVSEGLAVMVMALGLPPVYLGTVGFFAESGDIRWVLAMIALAGMMMIAGGVQTIRRHRRDVRRERRHRAWILTAVGRPPAYAPPAREGDGPDDAGPVLAHWIYSGDQWMRHAELERRGGCAEMAGFALGIVLLGGYFGDGDPRVIGVVLLATAILFAARGLTRRSSPPDESGPLEAIITPAGLVLNGEYHVLTGGQFRLVSVRREDATLLFHVGGRGAGAYGQMVRVPVPPGREDEADAVVSRLRRLLERPSASPARRR